jgi:hypothetical protein
LSWFWWVLAIGVLIIWIASVADIIRRRHTFSKAALFAWILVVIIFPVIGSLVYLMVNGAAGGRSGEPGVGGSGRMV